MAENLTYEIKFKCMVPEKKIVGTDGNPYFLKVSYCINKISAIITFHILVSKIVEEKMFRIADFKLKYDLYSEKFDSDSLQNDFIRSILFSVKALLLNTKGKDWGY